MFCGVMRVGPPNFGSAFVAPPVLSSIHHARVDWCTVSSLFRRLVLLETFIFPRCLWLLGELLFEECFLLLSIVVVEWFAVLVSVFLVLSEICSMLLMPHAGGQQIVPPVVLL